MKLRDWFELVRIQLKREEGQTMAEYGLLIALIAVIVMGAVLILGQKISAAFTQVSNAI
jgi:pilus assembly protein Flp/PilA